MKRKQESRADLLQKYKEFESQIYAAVAWEGRLGQRVHSRLNKMFTIVEDMARLGDNEFAVSPGNILVMETFPSLMSDIKFRKKLRIITLNYLVDKEMRKPLGRVMRNVRNKKRKK